MAPLVDDVKAKTFTGSTVLMKAVRENAAPEVITSLVNAGEDLK